MGEMSFPTISDTKVMLCVSKLCVICSRNVLYVWALYIHTFTHTALSRVCHVFLSFIHSCLCRIAIAIYFSNLRVSPPFTPIHIYVYDFNTALKRYILI